MATKWCSPFPLSPWETSCIEGYASLWGPTYDPNRCGTQYVIAGWGKDQFASLIVLVAVRCGLWGGGVFEEQLNMAYQAFSR